ncbi:MAG TPA: 3'-5' exonuclease, partial [Pirellulales bacterium]|nr:3'-5' exonuclease [Pirellulales bacterium]
RGDDQRMATLQFAADEVRRLARQHPKGTIGVLARRNETVARLIYLLRNHPTDPVLASEEGGNPLTDSVAVQLLLSLLKIADHPGDTIARFHVARSHLGEVVNYTNWRDDAAARQLADRLRSALGAKGYGPTLAGCVRRLAEHCDARELSRLSQLIEQAYAFDAVATSRTDDFIGFVEHTKVEDPTAAPVRVMTIHQAKGLQFDVVVLPELDVRLQGQPRKVVVDRDEAGGPVVRVCRYAPEEIQRLLPQPIQSMFKRWPDQVVHESLCLLYVAMTRAVHALHMIVAPPAANERSIPKTFAGVLCSGLVGSRQELSPGEVAYEHGSDDWDAAPTNPPPAEAEMLRVSLAPVRSKRRRSLERVAPSSLAGGPRVDLQHRLRLDQAEALARGTLMHAWFEAIAWLDDPAPTDDELLAIAKTADVGTLDRTAAIADFRAIIAKPNIRLALSRLAYQDLSAWGLPKLGPQPRLEVHRERGFIVRHENALVRGAIDRLVLVYQGEALVAADVIDFKTDAVSDSRAIDQCVERYRPQVEAYRHAAVAITGLPIERIGVGLLFCSAGIVRRL